MSKTITVECDSKEIRMAVGSTGLTGLSVDHVASAPLSLEEGETAWGTPSAISALRELLSQAGIKNGNVIACVSRNDIELRAITMPKVDPNELPDMVRFAAPRYFANVNDNWPLDYITLPSHLEGSVDCVVGAISPNLIQKIDATMTAAGLTLKHMVLRPMAAALGAMTKHPEWMQSTVLFIDLLNDEADVMISERGNAVFMRTFYSPSDLHDPNAVKPLASEVKRTLVSAVSQRPGLQVDKIVVWTKDSLATFADALSKAAGMPVTMLDPFSIASKARIEVAATTETVGRFAPVIGALQFPAASDRVIDFANPRKRVEAKKPIGKYIAAAAAGILGIGAAYWAYASKHAEWDQKIAAEQEAIKADANILPLMKKNIEDWKKLETFLQGDILWIDELERLSEYAKDSESTYFGGTTFAFDPRAKTANVNTTFYTTEQDLVPEIQSAYRGEKHQVRGVGLAQSRDKKYPVSADMQISIGLNEVLDPRKVERKPIQPKTDPAGDATTTDSKSDGQTPTDQKPEDPASQNEPTNSTSAEATNEAGKESTETTLKPAGDDQPNKIGRAHV